MALSWRNLPCALKAAIVNVQRRYDAVGDHTGAKPARRAAAHLAIEHQAYLARAANIEVLADYLLEENPACHRLIKDLGERELGLQYRELIAITGSPVAGRKWMRQAPQP